MLFLAALALPVAAQVPLPAAPTRYVTDAAGVLDDARENALNERLAQYERETSNQVIVYVDRAVPAGTTLEDMGAEAIIRTIADLPRRRHRTSAEAVEAAAGAAPATSGDLECGNDELPLFFAKRKLPPPARGSSTLPQSRAVTGVTALHITRSGGLRPG